MSDITDRLLRIGRAYLDSARGRLQEVDAAAQAELERAFPDGQPGAAGLPRQQQGDAWERASAKVAASRARATEADVQSPASVAAPALAAAYKIIGVPETSDYVTVEMAVSKLRRRCDPLRFPEGSPEQDQARNILAKVESAFAAIQAEHGPPPSRFDRLEL